MLLQTSTLWVDVCERKLNWNIIPRFSKILIEGLMYVQGILNIIPRFCNIFIDGLLYVEGS